MFSWFAKKNTNSGLTVPKAELVLKNEPFSVPAGDQISESEQETVCDDTEPFFTGFELLLKPHGQILYESSDRKICLVEPISLINFVKPFSYNRSIDDKHKKKLYDVLCNQADKKLPVELYGLFEGFMTKTKTIYLANGHHRFFAYKDFLTEHHVEYHVENDGEQEAQHHSELDIRKVKMELFIFDDLDDDHIEEDERVIELFRAVNTSKEFQFNDLPIYIIYESFKMLNDKYTNCIKQGAYVRKPHLNKTKFYECLKSNDIHIKYSTPKKLYNKLVKINEAQESKTINDFFDKLNTSRINQYEKAKKMNFYLGLMGEDELLEELV